jgi:hypothetical protein
MLALSEFGLNTMICLEEGVELIIVGVTKGLAEKVR